MSKSGDLENRALRILVEAGSEGILQSELWKKLELSSKEGSRLALRFERRGLIERKKVLYEGRWTYRLFSKRRNISLESVADSPCILCEEMDKCSEGGAISPVFCNKLTDWILSLAKKAESKR
jgi:DNA-binding MarR family transcriptional regulator